MEVDKQLSSDELDKDCSILLELAESDPLFDKKKKLLQDNGFHSKEQIRIKRSSDPSWLSTTLKVMVRIARIIKLDEVELYFAGEEQLDSYSPRNELEALNSILQLVESSLSGACEMQKNVLQDLHNVIVDKICQFAENSTLKTTIVEGQNSDKEKQLLQWGENNGVKTRLQINYVKGAGRGAIAREDLKVGDTALEIPTSLIICEELVQKTDMYHVLEKLEDTSSETMLLLWSMKERYNSDSQYKIYFDTLPEDFHTGLSFGISAMMSLYGTLLLDEIMQAKEHLRAQYDKLFPALCNEHPDIFPRELYTWEQFLWACELWYSNSMKIMFADGKLRTCLIPIAGLLNHSILQPNTLKFRLSRPCNAGQECCLSYGNLSTSHLVTFYGFLPQGNNPYDVIPLDIGGAEEDSTEGSFISEWTLTWRARNPMLLTKTLLPENLENEIEILEDLLSIFNDMMDSLGDADLDDRKNTTWDVKMAVEFKVLQRGIVSSILTSCHKGLEMVKHELSKMHG
ncbi:hypothetical protein M0R45_019024 [Rubus argutus]|uniref:Rubisco LSMT substrate-binding domain-containing protein n=1 Tax=Rubus argutus TaxID=59490 RepID=A0AAW1X4P9_RUBAR